jgi:cytochrome P450
MVMYTDNAEVIRQVATRREHFSKFTEPYAILSIFGDSVLTTEGPSWKMHRKVTSASFNERNAALVFAVAIQQAQGMVGQWLGKGEQRSRTITAVDADTMRLALNIIGYVGFGLRLLWPGQTLPAGMDTRLSKYSALEPAEGHTLSFIDTIVQLLDNVLLLLIVPSWLLSRTGRSFLPAPALYFTNCVVRDSSFQEDETRR